MSKVLERWGHLGTTQYECSFCSKTFLVVTCFDNKKHPTSKRFCSKPCWYSWKARNIVPWNKGTKGVMKANSGSIKKGQHLSPATELKKGDCAGKKNNFWKGGITPINTRIRQSSEYKAWRVSVFTRDDYTCQFCFVRGRKLHADHIKPFASYPDLRLDINNGRTLCVDCHKQTPTYLNRWAVHAS